MIRNKIKQFLKTSPLIFNLLVGILYLYLKFAYITSRWKFTWEGPEGKNSKNKNDKGEKNKGEKDKGVKGKGDKGEGKSDDSYIEESKPALFAIWHCQLAYSIKIFGKYKKVRALASPHSDGKIIGGIVRRFGYDVIEGSSHKNASGALKEILSSLKAGDNVVITPDGPRGPANQVNSAITKIASKYGYSLIAASCKPSSYFTLNSWDKMMLPKPFSNIEVRYSKVIELTGNEEQDKELLKSEMG